MKFDVWGQTDVGLRRQLNEDSISIDRDLGLFVVADGMGGHEGGEVASNIAVRTTHEIIQSYSIIGKKISPEDLLRKCYTEACARIFHKGNVENLELMGMGTTMVMGLLSGDHLYIGNVGDSRAYLEKDGDLWQITEDHSWVNEQIKAGVITPEEAEHVSGKNVITRSVGFEKNVTPDIFSRKVEPGEKYLFCSDGLCGLINDKKISDLIAKNAPADVVHKCIDAAKAAGGDDNISIVLLKIN